MTFAATFRDHIPDTDWTVELDEKGTVHVSLNVQRDREAVWIKPEHWDAIVEMVARLRRAQTAAAMSDLPPGHG